MIRITYTLLILRDGRKKKHQKSVTRHFSQSFQPKHDILRYQEKTKGCKSKTKVSFFSEDTIKTLKKSLDVFKTINLIGLHTVANHSLYTDVVLFFFSFFSKTSESARKNIPRAIF